ncbi:hypothetical protein CcI156_05875 [Frankia sp. CcI156]|nr:hypothetical protein CgIS1_05815 [Frankia sp. CgIS1]ONH28237.1 hypothetical protein CcI156_05875 [Frankia sp. CcI156]
MVCKREDLRFIRQIGDELVTYTVDWRLLPWTEEERMPPPDPGLAGPDGRVHGYYGMHGPWPFTWLPQSREWVNGPVDEYGCNACGWSCTRAETARYHVEEYG